MNNKTKNTEFEDNVKSGLTSYPKHLSSKFIYDSRGDKLFQDIMAMPDYYLTNCEFEILKNQAQHISQEFDCQSGFDLIELGAGDGKKTKILLKHLVEKKANFKYFPVDISQNILDGLEKSLHDEIPEVDVETLQGTYFDILSELSTYNKRQKVILVLGSNIGNLMHDKAIDFLEKIQENMSSQDLLFMGFDQKKDPEIILKAYNDSEGITEAFNKNLLNRINREFEANFDLDSFKHWETYNPETGTAKSFLVSLKPQKVIIKALNLEVDFAAWESIHTEISQKYDDETVEWLAGKAKLKIHTVFESKNNFYKNYLFKKMT
ncbi:MAG: L-histidine N(alpha)-methyltransferase [Psychroflexus sp.]